jgi:hypothetical protein
MRNQLLVLVSLTAGLVFTSAPTFAAGGCCDGSQMEPVTEVARQVAVVSFTKPVKVGEWVLLGKYIIEHDNNRMARGLPCTHIYAANRPQVPVVRFHCTHLERDRVERDTVVLKSTGDAMIRELAAFQFAGETAAHGVPAAR